MEINENKIEAQNFYTIEDGGSPDARLRFARLTLARLRLNDGAKLWVSFKLCFKQMIFIAHIGEIYYKGLDIPSSIPLITIFSVQSEE